jgi:branched-chain amino acid transport system permease protein
MTTREADLLSVDPVGPTPHTRRCRVSTSALIVVGLIVISVLFGAFASPYSTFLYNTFLWTAIGAIALNVLQGGAGQVSIGNAAFLAVGAFGTVYFHEHSVVFPFDILLGSVIAAAVGLIVGIPALRIRGIYLALATLAAQFIIIFFAERYQSDTVGAAGFQLEGPFKSYGLNEGQQMWSIVLTGVLCLIVIAASVLMSGRSGRAARMIRDHEAAAPAIGINVTITKLVFFVVTSAFVGLAGGLGAYDSGFVTADQYTLQLGISFLAMIIIGGVDSIAGSLIGAAIIVWLPSLTSDWTGRLLGQQASAHSADIAQIIYGLLIIIFVVLSPGGIAGWLRSLIDWLRSLIEGINRRRAQAK